VHKRLSILLLLCLGLVWAASPALACAQMPERDCCPPGTQTPCGGDQSGLDLRAVAALCCVSVPVSSSAATADEPRPTSVQPHDNDSPDAFALVAWFATLEPPEREPPPLPPDAFGTRTDASLTYLHTRRLRL
jgi:hypothetical protein